jgi:hypothetical protein
MSRSPPPAVSALHPQPNCDLADPFRRSTACVHGILSESHAPSFLLPVGHTFCRTCFVRATDHSNKCPMCRTVWLRCAVLCCAALFNQGCSRTRAGQSNLVLGGSLRTPDSCCAGDRSNVLRVGLQACVSELRRGSCLSCVFTRGLSKSLVAVFVFTDFTAELFAGPRPRFVLGGSGAEAL